MNRKEEIDFARKIDQIHGSINSVLSAVKSSNVSTELGIAVILLFIMTQTLCGISTDVHRIAQAAPVVQQTTPGH